MICFFSIFFASFFIKLSAQSNPYEKIIIFLIHGTFGKDSSWYQEKGGFFKALKNWSKTCGTEVEIRPFSWSGSLLASERLAAALNLSKKLIFERQSSDQENTKIIIIGHSHGANIAFLASQLIFIATNKSNSDVERGVLKLVNQCLSNELDKQLFKTCNTLLFDQLVQKIFVNVLTKEINELLGEQVRSGELGKTISIDEIYALGAPIDVKRYFPEKNIAKKIYSFYSLGDKIQIYSNPFKRRFSEFELLNNNSSEFISEIKITMAKSPNSKGLENPCHTQLSNACIGRWICETPKLIESANLKTNIIQNCSQFMMQFYADLSQPTIKAI